MYSGQSSGLGQGVTGVTFGNLWEGPGGSPFPSVENLHETRI